MTWELGPFRIFCYFLLHVFGMSTGFAFGALFLSTPVAIVVYFVYGFIISSLFEVGAALLDWFKDIRPWVDFSYAQNPIIEADVSGKEWAQLAVSGLIWLVSAAGDRHLAGAAGRGEVGGCLPLGCGHDAQTPRSDGRSDDAAPPGHPDPPLARPRGRVGPRRVRPHPRAVRGLGLRGRAAVAQGLGPGLGDG